MANFHKFKCTYKGSGSFLVGGNMYSDGDIFTLTEDKVRQYINATDIINGFLEYQGESDGTGFSSNILSYLNGKQGMSKNVMPAFTIPLCTSKAVTVQGVDLAESIAPAKRCVIDKLLVNMTAVATSGSEANTPRLLATAGAFDPKTPTTLRYYDSSTTTYGAITNGSMTNAAPITWAANDLMIVGYTEKFASVNVTFTTAATAGLINAVYYWNGSSWTAFTTYTDYTKEPGATNSFDRAGLETNTRVVWWEKPDTWVRGGPISAACNPNDYCIAMRVSGALTNLAGGALWVLTDTPLCDIGSLGPNNDTFDAVVQVLGAGPAYTDYTTEAGNADVEDVPLGTMGAVATDAFYFGYASKFGGLSVTAGVIQDVAGTINLYYWTGKRWSAVATVASDGWGGTVTNGTDVAGDPFKQSGRITWLQSPPDWVADVATNLTGLTTNTPATVTTEALYWIKLTATSAGFTNPSSITYVSPTFPTNVDVEFNAAPQCYVGADDPIHVYVVDEDASATLTVTAVASDI